MIAETVRFNVQSVATLLSYPKGLYVQFQQVYYILKDFLHWFALLNIFALLPWFCNSISTIKYNYVIKTCPCHDSENNDTKNNNNHIDDTKYSNNNSVTPDMGNKTRRRLSRSLVSFTNFAWWLMKHLGTIRKVMHLYNHHYLNGSMFIET